MQDVEVHIDLDGDTHALGLLRRHSTRGGESLTFEYEPAWLANPNQFSIEPALRLGEGLFPTPRNQAIFGSIGDSAPDTWGRRLMQRSERRRADREGRTLKTLTEVDYLLGVEDVTRLGALRFRWQGEAEFQSPERAGVPPLLELGKLLGVTERILRDEETDEDFQLIFAPGSSLGGARPKASIIDAHGELSIAKFPKETDEYSIELWEEIALRLAATAGIETPHHSLVEAAGKQVLLSRRFDRHAGRRVPFLSAMSMLGLSDGQQGSYIELVDALTEHGSNARADAQALFRRLAFNVLVSNVDDHMRNHGFLWQSRAGWSLSPIYDVNPTPVDVRPRILTTNIDFDEGTCSIGLVESVSGEFGMGLADARTIIGEVGRATAQWRDVAAKAGARAHEIRRMESAFEHGDLRQALTY